MFLNYPCQFCNIQKRSFYLNKGFSGLEFHWKINVEKFFNNFDGVRYFNRSISRTSKWSMKFGRNIELNQNDRKTSGQEFSFDLIDDWKRLMTRRCITNLLVIYEERKQTFGWLNRPLNLQSFAYFKQQKIILVTSDIMYSSRWCIRIDYWRPNFEKRCATVSEWQSRQVTIWLKTKGRKPGCDTKVYR